MDLEILSGLQNLDDDGMAGAMMGLDQFNYLSGDDDPETQMMLGALAGYNPELAMMMGWNPFSTVWKGVKALGRGAQKVGNALLPGNPFGGVHKKAAVRNALAAHQTALARPPMPAYNPYANPLAQPTPLSAVQPQLPGVPDRGGRVQPLGFENGAFTAAGPAVVTVRARPQRPIRGGRLVADFSRTGATATGLLTLVQLVVATDGQLLSGDPISFAALSPNAFGVGVNLSPAAVGNEIFATVAISALPAMTDRVDFNLTLFGLTVG
jgi:hypothetical protein